MNKLYDYINDSVSIFQVIKMFISTSNIDFIHSILKKNFASGENVIFWFGHNVHMHIIKTTLKYFLSMRVQLNCLFIRQWKSLIVLRIKLLEGTYTRERKVKRPEHGVHVCIGIPFCYTARRILYRVVGKTGAV